MIRTSNDACDRGATASGEAVFDDEEWWGQWAPVKTEEKTEPSAEVKTEPSAEVKEEGEWKWEKEVKEEEEEEEGEWKWEEEEWKWEEEDWKWEEEDWRWEDGEWKWCKEENVENEEEVVKEEEEEEVLMWEEDDGDDPTIPQDAGDEDLPEEDPPLQRPATLDIVQVLHLYTLFSKGCIFLYF